LSEIWAEVIGLGAHPIGVRDNFLELGGDSVALIRMLSRVRNELGANVGAREFFARPTIEHLCELVGGGSGAPASSTLIPVQERGSRPPIHCVPAADGSMLVFKNVLKELGPDQPFYGFEVPSVRPGGEQVISIAEIARRNVASLRAVQPTGPYWLAGYCWGCTVAAEMARQIVEQGDAVAQLILIDPLHPGSYRFFLANPLALIGVMVQVLNPGREIDLMSLEAFEGRSLDEQLAAAFLELRKGHLLPDDMVLDLFTTTFRQFRNCFAALVAHEPGRYDGAMALVTVDDYPEDWVDHWRRIAAGLCVLPVRGMHYSILSDQILATELVAKLRPLLPSGGAQ
ncbi:MAG TPA: non-ribosomal peptide synthetase, partial [Kofleriaceae bacterium]